MKFELFDVTKKEEQQEPEIQFWIEIDGEGNLELEGQSPNQEFSQTLLKIDKTSGKIKFFNFDIQDFPSTILEVE